VLGTPLIVYPVPLGFGPALASKLTPLMVNAPPSVFTALKYVFELESPTLASLLPAPMAAEEKTPSAAWAEPMQMMAEDAVRRSLEHLGFMVLGGGLGFIILNVEC
jgi:hypothetical protein